VFTAGAAALDIVFAVGLLLAANASGAFDGGGSDAGAIVDLVLGAVFLALGVRAVFSRESPETQASQRERIERAAAGGLRGMLVTGVAAQVINIDALTVFTGAIKEVAEADVSTVQAAVALAIALAVMLTPYYLPAVLYALSPQRSGRVLGRMSDWLLDHSRALEIVVGIGFGAVFLAKGIAGL
jgi:threonine/homoserine/homoserine lactone efflux protein